MRSIDLSGKVALVTGAGQGLGEAIAQALHSAGATVAVNYFPDLEGTNRAHAHAVADGLGERAAAFPADVRDLAQAETMVGQIGSRFGRLDIVVNNAGILRDKTLKNLTAQMWQDVIDTNLTGVFNVCKAAGPAISDGGRIVSISSVAAFVGFFGQANYGAAKAGVVGLTRVLSREMAKRNITVNAVAPGVVETGMGKTLPEQALAEMLRQVPLGRFADPREIADVVLFLCSDLASYVTGHTVHVNGGWYS